MKRLGVATILTVLIFGAVYGIAAVLPISGVRGLGSGTAAVPSTPDVTLVRFVIASNGLDVDKVYIDFASGWLGNVYVRLKDSGGSTISSAGPTWVSGGPVTVDVPDVPAAAVYYITITAVEE